MKVIICGTARMGKDTFAEILRDKHGVTFEGSSSIAARLFIYNALKDIMGYSSLGECYEDRHNWRPLWSNLIKAFNRDNPTRLLEEGLKKGHLYIGLRDSDAVAKAVDEGLVDLIVWVDAGERVSYREGKDSMDITIDIADVVVDNNGTYEDLVKKADEFYNTYLKEK